MKKSLLAGLTIGGIFLGTTSMAIAGTIEGYLYDSIAISGGTLMSAQLALQNLANNNASGLTLDDQFSVDTINFDSSYGSQYGQFLSGGATNPNGLAGLDAPWANTNLSTSSELAAMFQFKGTAEFSSNFSINHDDGFILTLTNYAGGPLTIDKSWPVSPTLDTFNITAGKYDFVLTYQSWNGTPEVLQSYGITPDPVPEPATMLLFGTGIAGLAAVGRRKRS